MRINIYQLDSDKDENRVKFCNYDLHNSTAVFFRRTTSAFFMAMWTEIWKMSSRCSIHPSIPEPTRDIHSRFRM